MFTRTPCGRAILDERAGPAVGRLVSAKARDPELFRQFIADNTSPDEVAVLDVEAFRRSIIEGTFDPHVRKEELSLTSIAVAGQMCAEVLLKLDWQFVYADESELFLTSDSPVVSGVWDDEAGTVNFRMGFDRKGADIAFPLSRTLLLRMKKRIEAGPCRLRAERGVRYFNKSIIICAFKRVYAAECSEKLRKLFDKRGCGVPIELFEPCQPV